MHLWFLALAACGGQASFDDVERVVTIGDNVASSPGWSRSFVALLAENDDDLFPDFAGSDLSTRLPDAELIRLDRGGDSYYTLADDDQPWCTCGTGCTDACLDPADTRQTLVVVELGVNDLVALALAMLNNPSLRADPTPRLDEFQADVGAVLAHTQDPGLFPEPPLVYVTNVYDPSDGVGDVADLVTSFFPFPGAEEVTPELGLAIIDGFNTAIAAEAEEIDATVVDVHTAYLGHGYHYNDEDTDAYDPEDPSFWFSTVIDPNLRGAHEIRRTVWASMTGEAIDTIPTGLPVESQTGMPPVPADGWAKEVVGSEVTAELDDGTTVYTNIAADPSVALGEPTGSTFDVVAIGTLGAWLAVDLGEATQATDGEGADLVVLEYGQLSGGTPEPYRVQVSDGPDGPWTIIGDAFGEHAFDLAEADIAKARYVRLESLAQPAEVLGGLGSPYYPGPEIDALGAVYPGP